ncbi:hypothetical protein FRC08_008863 [Ceratobasidium sp. 394]|nr:hypothetical protein FRC08_008863 [Ceratobasidium sp. 394]KAG9089936.1 hypothetical protein FS749_000943 [Ceratobasidium sp. UAMH 11750]
MEPRPTLPPVCNLHSTQPGAPPSCDERLAKVHAHCQTLCALAGHHATVSPNPDWTEITQMVEHAVEVIAILEEYNHALYPLAASGHEQSNRRNDAKITAAHGTEGTRTRHEIGVKHASPPGRCHSCDIPDSLEWRYGPDGQRTLCRVCGLHYAKLVRKRNKSQSTLPSGRPPPPLGIAFPHQFVRLVAKDSTPTWSVGHRRAADELKGKAGLSKSMQDADAKADHDVGRGRKGWDCLEDEAEDQPILSPAQNTFPCAQAQATSTRYLSSSSCRQPLHLLQDFFGLLQAWLGHFQRKFNPWRNLCISC